MDLLALLVSSLYHKSFLIRLSNVILKGKLFSEVFRHRVEARDVTLLHLAQAIILKVNIHR